MTSYNDSRQTAISADAFKKLTRHKINLNSKEIVVVIEERGTKKAAKFNDKEISFCLKNFIRR